MQDLQSEFTDFYYLIVTIVFILSLLLNKCTIKSINYFSVFVILLTAIFIGYRDISVGTDTIDYYHLYNGIYKSNYSDIFESIGEIASEPLFFLIIKTSSIVYDSYHFAFTIISLITLSFVYVFCTRVSYIFRVNPLSLLCCYLISFYVISQQINIIRAGLATAFLLNYYLSVFQGEKKGALIYGIIALGIHFTSIFGIVFALLAKHICLDRKKCMVIFFIILFFAYMNKGILNIGYISGMDLGAKSGYLSSVSANYVTGFKFGFALFNTFFALIFYKYLSSDNGIYHSFFRLYILFSCLLFACFQIPFSDRIGGFSWNLIPFLAYFSVFGLFKKNRQYIAVCTFLFLFIIRIGVT